MTSIQSIAASLAIILIDLLGRAGLDKVLALANSPAEIGLWAQLQSVFDLIAGVAITGVLQGLTVMTAQTRDPRDEAGLLQSALKLALAISICLSLIVALVTVVLATKRSLGGLERDLVMIAIAAGCAFVIPATVNAYWLGKHQQQRMLALAVLLGMVWLLVAVAAWFGFSLRGLMLIQSIALLALGTILWRYLLKKGHLAECSEEHKEYISKLMKFVPAGLAIGIMSPVSMLLIRGLLSKMLSWNDVGFLQALWRSTDWITATSAGILSLVFLPRLSSAYGSATFKTELIKGGLIVLVPAGILMLLLFFYQREVLSLLYDSRFVVSNLAAALFMLGSWVRIASWVFLFGLFAAHRTWMIVIGEVLSLPLFALLLWCFGTGMTLERAASLFLLSYLVYLIFNAVALIQVSDRVLSRPT
ncbi:MAG: hypothetical protein WA632_05720 [Gallionella sp.]